MEQQRSRKINPWLLLIILTSAFAISFIARVIWSPFIEPASIEFGIQPAQAGLFISLFYIGYMVTQLPGGMLADKFGVKYVLSGSVLVTALFTLAIAFVTNYNIALACRFVAGLGSGAIVACSSKAIANAFPPEKRGTALGIFFVATTAGLFLSNTIAPLALQVGTWRTGFLWIGIAALVIAAIIFLVIEKEPKKETQGNIFDGVIAIVKSRNVLIMAITGFCYIWLVLAVATWANNYMRFIGIDGQAASGVMRWYSIGGIIATLITGWLVDQFKLNRRFYTIATYVAIIAMTFVFSSQKSLMGLTIAAFIYGFVSYLPNAHLTTLVIEYAGDEYAGTAVGGTNFFWQFGAVVSPPLAGQIFAATGSYNSVWMVLAGALVVGMIALLMLKPVEKKTA